MLVSELDLECELWIKLRLAPLPPHVGTISLAFVGQPTVRVQLAPYNRVRLMRIPILQVRAAALCIRGWRCMHSGTCLDTPNRAAAGSDDRLWAFASHCVQDPSPLPSDTEYAVAC